jgi:hypothetical protein
MNFNELFQKMRDLDQPVTEEPNEGNAFSGALDAAKDAGKDEFEVDGKTFQVKEDDVEECGMGPMPSMNQEQQDTVTMNLSMNGSGSGGIRDLLDILKNIDGEDGGEEQLGKLMGKMDKEPIIGDADMPMDEYANSPDEAYGTVGDVTPTGNDLHSKGAEAEKVNGGGNPFDVSEELVNRLASMYESIKSRDNVNETLNEFDVSLMQPTNAGFNSMFGANISGTPEVKAIIKTMKPEDYVETNKFKQEYPSADTYLEKNKWRDVVMGRQHQDMYNFVQRYNRDNNNLSIAQWLEKAKNSIKGAVTGQPAEPVSYNAARFDPTTAKTHGYGMDTTKPEKAFPMKESNEIVKLSKMLNG